MNTHTNGDPAKINVMKKEVVYYCDASACMPDLQRSMR
jgi:hypothetical protein